MLTACSSDDDVVTSGGIELTPGNSDVKIQLSSGSGRTRAAIESDENDLTFEAEGLGIFCLANGTVTGATQPGAINWKYNPSDEISKYSVWLANVKADAVINNVDGVKQTDIIFKDAGGDEVNYYYPLANWHTYQFYGYYPIQEAVNYESSFVMVDIPIDGKSDIIWGQTHGNPADDAYCAKYFRTTGHAGEIPSIAFEHKLMQLQFYCKPGLKNGVTDEDATKMIIKNVTVGNVPQKGTLIVANSNEASANYSGRFFCYNSYGIQDLKIVDSDESETLTPVVVGNETGESGRGKKIGQSLLVPVLGSAESGDVPQQYSIRLELAMDTNGNGTYDKGTDKDLDIYPDIILKRQAGSQLFGEAGKKYNVTITIYSPQDIKLKATLTPWEEEDVNIEY